ncbi:hypothetical protein CBS9595_001141 [Malassezia furfur]|nr:hypothetical protein CBS9595_001141 [Malassezia furfur]
MNARYLEENAVDEWRKAYINYRGLKKLIKRVHEHHEARIALKLEVPVPNVPQPARTRAGKLLRRGTSFFTNKSDSLPHYGSTDDDRFSELPPVSLEGTGLSLPRSVPPDARNSEDLESHGTHTLGTSSSVQYSKADKRSSAHGPHVQEPGEPDAYPGETESTEHPVPIAWVTPDPKAEGEDIDKLIPQLFDSEERKFFLALDEEVARIVHFYEEREREAIERLSTLVTQLTELAEHRREFKAQTQKVVSGAGLSRIFSSVPLKMGSEELKRARLNAQHIHKDKQAESAVDAGDKRRAKAMEHVQALNIDALQPGTPSSENHDVTHAVHDPVQYRAARKKLRTAVIENHRALEILNNYRILNRTGFTKILKKFDKTMDSEVLQPYYQTRVCRNCSAQPKVGGATHPEIFTVYFEHGDAKRARDLLREPSNIPPGMREHNHHKAAFRTGLYLGVALCATIQGLRDAMRHETRATMPNWAAVMQLYGAEFIPTMFALLFGLNLVGWQAVRINTVFIFEWDARHALEPAQYFEMPALLLLLLSIFFWVSFAQPMATSIAPSTWPLVWLVIVVLLLLNPLPVLHPSSRRWFVVSLSRVFTGGVLYSVEFRDFFLGDELNSVMYSFGNLWFLGCEYDHHFRVPDQCSMTRSWWIPVLIAIPAFLRFLQCFRRYVDSRRLVRIHLVNAGKYASSVLNAFFYFHYRRHGSTGGTPFALWVLFATINSTFTCSWDFIMDWNVLQRNAKYPLLRNNLAFAEVWPLYYVAMATNLFVRFIWVIYLFGGPATVPLRSFLAALLEMLRRWQWNFILPLPYPTTRPKMVVVGGDDDDDDKDSTHSGFSMRPFSMRSGNSQAQAQDDRTHQTLQRTRDGLQEARRRNTHELVEDRGYA